MRTEDHGNSVQIVLDDATDVTAPSSALIDFIDGLNDRVLCDGIRTGTFERGLRSDVVSASRTDAEAAHSLGTTATS
jgi:hypothetical protein